MNQIKVCKKYIEKTFSNWISVSDFLYKIPFSYDEEGNVSDFKLICIVTEKEQEDRKILFNKDFELLLSESEKETSADYYAFCFGEQFYYVKSSEVESPKLHILRYLGISEISNESYVALGNHTTYSLLDGCQKIDLWVEKAKYLQMKALGICERNSMRSILSFQSICKKQNIKPILGEELKIKIDNDYFWIKFYVKNLNGYRDLVLLSNALNISARSEGNDFLAIENLEGFLQNLIVILPNNFPFKKYNIKNLECEDLYYQVDTKEFLDLDIYYNYLNNIKKFLNADLKGIKPVLCEDAFYLEEGDKYLRKIEHEIASNRYAEPATKSLHFKTLTESIEIFSQFWKNKEEKFDSFFSECIFNTLEISDKCNFELKFEKLHIPTARIDIEDWEECLKKEEELKPSKIF